MSKYYYYARPDRDNWIPTVKEVREFVAFEILKGRTLEDVEGSAFNRFHCVSNTYWKEFWQAVTNVHYV